jgi:probable HAF family extracellular repeat protein
MGYRCRVRGLHHLGVLLLALGCGNRTGLDDVLSTSRPSAQNPRGPGATTPAGGVGTSGSAGGSKSAPASTGPSRASGGATGTTGTSGVAGDTVPLDAGESGAGGDGSSGAGGDGSSGAGGEGGVSRASFRTVGALPTEAPYKPGSFMTALSADGRTVVGYERRDSSRAWRWTEARGLESLVLPNDSLASFAYDVSHDGSVIVGTLRPPAGDDARERPFRWTLEGGVGALALPDASPGERAQGTNRDGTMLVGDSSVYGELVPNGYVWTEALGFVPTGGVWEVSRVSADSSTIIGRIDEETWGYPARWTSELGLVRVADLLNCMAYGVSADGSVIVGGVWNFNRLGTAFRWRAGSGADDLGTLPGDTHSRANGVSSDGSVVVGQSVYLQLVGNFVEKDRAFIWDAEHGMRSIADVLAAAGIDTSDWQLESAEGVSGDGRVVAGNGRRVDGTHPEAWIATLPP